MTKNEEEKEILLLLVQGIDGKTWVSGSTRVGWASESDEKVCQWDGIECDTKTNIIAILLATSGLSASLPSQLGKLTSLKKINLQMNLIKGTVPFEIASLPHLEVLDLSTNLISGSLPSSFASPNLQILALRSNLINGPIPTKLITATSSLKQVSLSQNQIYGTIPSSFYELSSLDTLDLRSNRISGTISERIGDLRFLQNLYLDNNTLVGSIPSTLANPQQLKEIWLNHNQLSGTIPIQLSELSSLRTLFLHNNKLTGEIPSDLCSELLNADFFRGTPIDHDKNYCDAVACPSDQHAAKNSYPCSQCLNGHYNPYIGLWGPCATDVNQRDIMKKFYNKTTLGGAWTDGGDGKKADNWMDELTFLCDFTGVTCNLNFHVIEINLSNRGLHGTIPGEIGFLPYLEVLNVSDNNLSGFLPSDLRWAPLTSLDISGNRIEGIIPPTLCAKGDLNSEGGANDFDCDHVACPALLFSPSGRRDVTKDEYCEPCHHKIPLYLGFKGCKRTGVPSNVFGFVFTSVTLVIAVVVFLVVYLLFRRKMVSKFRNDEGGGIDMYEFSKINNNEATKVEHANVQDQFEASVGRLDQYVASAGKGRSRSTVGMPYPDEPKNPQKMAIYKTMKTADQVNNRSMDGSANIGSINNGSTLFPVKKLDEVNQRSTDCSISSRSTRSSGSRRSNGSRSSQTSERKKAYGKRTPSKQPNHMQKKTTPGSDNSKKGDAKVWLDVPVV